MIVAIASGKGGTGKTSLAINLARMLERTYAFTVQLLDCDVEEPNAHLFLPGTLIGEETINIIVPDFDPDKCDACDKCVEFCQFNALASVCGTPLLFPELCHGCSGCRLICPQDAIREKDYRIGVIKTTRSGNITLRSGCLDVGVSLASTLVNALKKRLEDGITTILDAPPGTACQAVATLRGADYVVLVTEPTPFGLHDLKLAVDTVRTLNLNFGVVVNRVGVGDDRVQRYCAAEGVPVLLEIPDDRRIAEAYSCGKLIVDAVPDYYACFEQLWQAIESHAVLKVTS